METICQKSNTETISPCGSIAGSLKLIIWENEHGVLSGTGVAKMNLHTPSQSILGDPREDMKLQNATQGDPDDLTSFDLHGKVIGWSYDSNTKAFEMNGELVDQKGNSYVYDSLGRFDIRKNVTKIDMFELMSDKQLKIKSLGEGTLLIP